MLNLPLLTSEAYQNLKLSSLVLNAAEVLAVEIEISQIVGIMVTAIVHMGAIPKLDKMPYPAINPEKSVPIIRKSLATLIIGRIEGKNHGLKIRTNGRLAGSAAVEEVRVGDATIRIIN